MDNKIFGFIFIGLAVAYGVQLLLTGWQARRYYKRLKQIRKDGLTSVGMSGGKWSGRIYGVLVVDPDFNILHAEKLSGFTIFSGLKSVQALIGQNAKDLTDTQQTFGLNKKQIEAFRNAAKEYFKADAIEKAPTKLDDIKSVRMYHKAKKPDQSAAAKGGDTID